MPMSYHTSILVFYHTFQSYESLPYHFYGTASHTVTIHLSINSQHPPSLPYCVPVHILHFTAHPPPAHLAIYCLFTSWQSERRKICWQRTWTSSRFLQPPPSRLHWRHLDEPPPPAMPYATPFHATHIYTYRYRYILSITLQYIILSINISTYPYIQHITSHHVQYLSMFHLHYLYLALLLFRPCIIALNSAQL